MSTNPKLSLVILAAGRGTRFLPLTETTPKSLIPILNKPALEHNLEGITEYIQEIVILVGYLGDKIREYFGADFQGIPIKYVEQIEYKGTGHALDFIKDQVISEQFILMYGDDLYSSDLVKQLIDTKDSCLIGKKVTDWQKYGVFKLDSNSNLVEIVEKPSEFVGDLVNIGLYKLDRKIFDYYSRIGLSPRGEMEFTDTLTLFAKDYPVKVIQTETGWFPLSYPWDILNVSQEKSKQIEDKRDGIIEQGVVIKGRLQLGKGSLIKSGSYLEGNFVIGEDCVIGPNASLRGFAAIGDGSEIGHASQVVRSVVGKNVNMKHLAYIGDSIIGNEVNIAGGVVTANLKHTHTNVKMMINGKLVDSGRTKLGTIVGDGAKLGINTSIYPGRKVDSGCWTLPGEVVKEDKIQANSSKDL